MNDPQPFRLEPGPPTRSLAGARWLWLAALLLPPAAAQEAPGADEAGSLIPAVISPDVDPDAADDSADDAADPAAGPAIGGTPATDQRERAARRLLHGSGGGVLRGTTRWDRDHWELQRDGRWERLPPGAFASARLETDVLAEARRREAAVRSGTAGQKVEVAAWMLDEGLLAECFELLDDVLDAEPDQPDALAFLGRDGLPIRLPSLDAAAADPSAAGQQAAVAGFLDWSADAPPALREVAVQQLVRFDLGQGSPSESQPESLQDSGAALRPELLQRLTGRSAGGRAFAALALRRLLPAGGATQPEVEELLRRAVLDVAPDVRRNASLALRRFGDEAVILPVVAALGSSSSTVRAHAAESLGLMGYSAATFPLAERLVSLQPGGGEFRPRANVFVGNQIAYVAGFDVAVANSAAIGNPEIGVLQEGASLDVTVLGVSSSSGYAAEVSALTSALQRLTGANPGKSKAAWKAWWEKNRQAWWEGDRR